MAQCFLVSLSKHICSHTFTIYIADLTLALVDAAFNAHLTVS